MAEGPGVPLPDIAQSGAPLSISPPQAAFGTAGQSLSEVGQTVGQGADILEKHAQAYQAINNQNAADAKSLVWSDTAAQKYEAFKANNQGLDENGNPKAETNLPGFLKEMESDRVATAQTLTNPMAQELFNQDSRRRAFLFGSDGANFAATERTKGILQTQKGVQDSAVSAIALDPKLIDDATPGSPLQKYMAAQALIDHQLGTAPTEAAAQRAALYGKIVADTVEVMAKTGNPTGAQAFLDAHKDKMDGQSYTRAQTEIAPAVMSNTIAGIADRAIQSTTGLGTGEAQGYLDVTNKAEGTGANPRSSAKGQGQFVNATWLGIMKNNPEFAQQIAGKTDAQILALRSDPTLGNQATLAYARQNAGALTAAGVPATTGNIGLAHHFGSAGAIEILQAPPGTPVETALGKNGPAVLAANPDLRGKTTGEIVADFSSRYGGVAGPQNSYTIQAQLAPAIAQARAEAAARFPGDDSAADLAEAKVRTRLGTAVQATENQENEGYQTAAAFAQAHPEIQDMATLYSAQPGLEDASRSWPAAKRAALEATVSYNGRAYSIDRSQNAQVLEGMLAQSGSSDDFKNTDLFRGPYSDLTTESRNHFLGEQAKLTDPNNPHYRYTQDDKLKSWIQVPQVSNIYKTIGADVPAPGKDATPQESATYAQTISDRRNFFLGALSGMVRSNHPDGKQPTGAELTGYAQSLVANQGKSEATWYNFEKKHEAQQEVPFQDQILIRQAYAAKGLGPPSAGDILNQYRLQHAR